MFGNRDESVTPGDSGPQRARPTEVHLHRAASAGAERQTTVPGRTSSLPNELVPDRLERLAYPHALAFLSPGPAMARHLASAPLADLPDLPLADTLVACGEMKAWAAAMEAQVIAEMGRRTERMIGEPSEFLVDEVAAALGMSGRAASGLVERATFLQVFPEVHDALADGRLTERKVDVLNAGTAHLPIADAARVLTAVLPRAERLTPPGLREAVRRVDLAEDPSRAVQRAARARRERCVWMEPAPDSMAYIRALLPATDAVRVMTGLDAVAAAAATEDERTLDQRRADALSDLVGAVLDRGVTPDGTLLSTRHGRRPHLQVTATLEAVAGLTETPAELAGYGPVPATVAREIAGVAAWTAVVVDPRTGEVAGRSTRSYRPTPGMAAAVLSRDVTCTFPGCRVPAERCDLDHVEPYRPGGGDDQTRTGNLAALCRHHHRMKTSGGWSVQRDHSTGRTIWRSRSGGVYTRDPVPAPVEEYPRPEGRRMIEMQPPDPPRAGTNAPRRADDDDDPPF